MNKKILEALSAVTVPVNYRLYRGNEKTYITFFEIIDRAVFHAENQVNNTSALVQVDIFSTGNYLDLLDQVKNLMKDAGFTYQDGRDFYESDTQLFHYVLTYRITKQA